MKVLYVQDPEKMTNFFVDHSKNRSNKDISERGHGGLGNALGTLSQKVIAIDSKVRPVTPTPQQSPPKTPIKVIDPNEKTVNQAKEEVKREDSDTYIPVTTGIKRKDPPQKGRCPKTPRVEKTCDTIADDSKKKKSQSKAKKSLKKTVLSVLSA